MACQRQMLLICSPIDSIFVEASSHFNCDDAKSLTLWSFWTKSNRRNALLLWCQVNHNGVCQTKTFVPVTNIFVPVTNSSKCVSSASLSDRPQRPALSGWGKANSRFIDTELCFGTISRFLLLFRMIYSMKLTSVFAVKRKRKKRESQWYFLTSKFIVRLFWPSSLQFLLVLTLFVQLYRATRANTCSVDERRVLLKTLTTLYLLPT